MNKKFITLLIIASLSSAILSGCGCSKKPETPSASPSPATEITATPVAETPEATPAAEMPEATAPAEAPETTPVTEDAKEVSVNPSISNEDATAEIQKVATKLMGEGTIVLPSNEGKAKEVDINGEKRICYMFGAAKLDLSAGETESTNIKNFYFDASTGEIFELAEDDSITKVN